MLGRLERAVRAYRLNARVLRAPAEDLPFDDDSFDVAVSTLVLCGVDDQPRALRELRRVLRPGGRLLLIEHMRSEDPAVARLQDRMNWLNRLVVCCDCNRPTLASVRQAGFTVDHLEHTALPKVPKFVAPPSWAAPQPPRPPRPASRRAPAPYSRSAADRAARPWPGLNGTVPAVLTLLARALAFEHRFAAAIADGGVVNVGHTWFSQLPPQLLDLYRSGDKATFDQYMRQAMAAPGAEAGRETWAFRGRPYGVQGYSAVLDEVAKYDVTDVAGQITTPLYITDPDGEQFFCGQPAALAALVPGSTLARFTQEEGASYHCQPMARELTEQRMFDWLDERVA
jgi:SAM-dependent methyltransferase